MQSCHRGLRYVGGLHTTQTVVYSSFFLLLTDPTLAPHFVQCCQHVSVFAETDTINIT